MEFDFEIQLLGYYYNVINQRMNAEQFRVEEAKQLANLLAQSFAGLSSDVNSSLSAALRGDAVFIFHDRNSHLYAYYPAQNLARITEIRYDRITKAKRAYKQ